MTMDDSEFAKALSTYLNGLPESVGVDHHAHHMPDSLCLAVQSFEDFREFLRFISDNADHGRYFELRDDFEATEFLAR